MTTLTVISGLLLPVSVVLGLFGTVAQVGDPTTGLRPAVPDGATVAVAMLAVVVASLALAGWWFVRKGWLTLPGRS